MKKTNLLFLSVFSIFLLASCGSHKKKEAQNSEDFNKAKEEVSQKIEKVIYNIPSPSDIPFLLQATGTEFDQSLLHDIDQVSAYSSDNTKAALNLGVYSADIGYLASYNRSQEALRYLTNVRVLAQQLALTTSFNPKTIDQFKNNLKSRDSMAAIVNHAITVADKSLRDIDRDKTAALIVAGSFTEGLYLATALVENYPEDILPDDQRMLVLIPIVNVILKQQKPIEDLISMLKSVDQDDATKKLVKQYENLLSDYKALHVEEYIKEGKGEQLLKDQTLSKITNRMGKIRDFVTY